MNAKTAKLINRVCRDKSRARQEKKEWRRLSKAEKARTRRRMHKAKAMMKGRA